MLEFSRRSQADPRGGSNDQGDNPINSQNQTPQTETIDAAESLQW